MLHLDAGMTIGVPVDPGSPIPGHAHGGQPPRAVARGGERAVERPVDRPVVERGERRRLARVVQHARHARAEVERRTKPLERRGGIAGDEHGVRARRRLARRRGQGMTGAGERFGVEGRMQLLDREAVLAAQAGERAARGGRDLGADPVAGEARDDVRPAAGHRWRRVVGGVTFMRWCSSRSVRPADAPLLGSRSACAPRMARERRSPLEGENRDELDAAADRYRRGAVREDVRVRRGRASSSPRVPEGSRGVNSPLVQLATGRPGVYDR